MRTFQLLKTVKSSVNFDHKAPVRALVVLLTRVEEVRGERGGTCLVHSVHATGSDAIANRPWKESVSLHAFTGMLS
jgi:hypothetical protein